MTMKSMKPDPRRKRARKRSDILMLDDVIHGKRDSNNDNKTDIERIEHE